ncbi:hypothetical protein [Acinetobacter vivianii]|uniref:Lipoprotein n=1 Tax=Acinetobacter vivianii TaxID=1776742 RepID=N9Q8Y9_9GAMM|nr:hypothetical protein [Acinetobacter vivianii]ENX22890.1 hypothetical protein F892_02133 [Acinetobacter vivianii]GGI61818.1 hypothetical protein GCM10011446_33130 [Acinetobacter vivianii]
MILNKKALYVTTLLSIGLIGCKNPISKHVDCDDPSAISLVQTVLKNDLDKRLDKELKSLIEGNVIKDLDPAKLKLSGKNVQYNIVDSRTDFIDPNSTRTKCAIDLTVVIPDDTIKKSNEARKKIEEDSIDKQATKLDVEYESNKVKLILQYVLQPTDKGDKVLAVVENTGNVQKLVSDILVYAFLKPQIEKNIIKNNEAARVYQRQAERAYNEAQEAADAAAQEAVDAAAEAENY